MNMVEKVARALTEVQIRSANELFKLSNPRRVKTEEQIIAAIESGWITNAKDARAAIEAMREPTEEMLSAGDKGCGEYGCSPARIGEIYGAMIFAALSEESTS